MDYCYAICFSNGIVKFGRTTDLHARLLSHMNQAAAHEAICTGALVSGSANAVKDEAAMIDHAKFSLKKVASGFEYFKGTMEDAFEVMAAVGLLPVPCYPNKAGSGVRFAIARMGMDLSNFRVIRSKETRTLVEAINARLANGPLGFGVLCNRIRDHSDTEIAAMLEQMIAEGMLTFTEHKHPKNKVVTKRYQIAG